MHSHPCVETKRQNDHVRPEKSTHTPLLLRRGLEHEPLRNLGRPRQPAGVPQGKPQLGSRVEAPATALFSGRELLFDRGRAGDPESGRGSRRAHRTG
ncbi:hypothetical protein NDU88_001289 [Pleurodeles waltl]|uniref:Uncharacterized protein n=1 Tax=Pleurodeles waltl TaxID=8319 RepID=A0AAV7U6T5_PLEWA|nr:hypothetical protein NDU88_001289 [Pleurodeles waltl]